MNKELLCVIYLQGDVGRDMYVVNKGLLEVLGGTGGNVVLTELESGSAFGEIRYMHHDGSERHVSIM